jgi:histone H3/H4
MSERIVPLAAMEKIIKNAGAERVSDPSKVALKEVVELFAEKIASQAVKLSHHAGRKTVKADDIKLAARSE